MLMNFGALAAEDLKQVLLESDVISIDRRLKIWPECVQGTFRQTSSNSIEMCLDPKDKAKRCEFAVNDALSHTGTYRVAFDFRVTTIDSTDSEWHSYFQVHSFPDKDERWRCPIQALELHSGAFRMFNRWDPTPVSITKSGTCSGAENSIQSRTLFQDLSLTEGDWHHYEQVGRLASIDGGELTVTIDQVEMATIKGPNTFNDQREPFLKFGIYKPTSWRSEQPLCVEYRDIQVTSGDHSNDTN
ncbi:hypothetical protein GCM10011369_02350 [Neiella marina]|uniref:Polysaccharide lyase n=2 Tax=Neiella marina TaxID=508461 RepID=A0A8J2U1Y2_9GAMM|nr:hypothetical protein GCM10011369_02350 [Neiella marina]